MRAGWDAATYHVVSNPHVAWGSRVLDRLPLAGDETVLDAGCGTGRVTEMLLERLPRGRVIALDRDPAMLARARETLARHRDRVRFVEASLLELPELQVDAIFSTATFHWVRDHDRLFANLFRALRPGGWLVAQCGGGPNLARAIARLSTILRDPRYARFFVGVEDPWYYATPEQTGARLAQSGFVDVETGLEEAPTPFASRAEFEPFVDRVILGQRLAPMGDSPLRAEVVRAFVGAFATDEPPFVLDYVRLNLRARRPPG